MATKANEEELYDGLSDLIARYGTAAVASSLAGHIQSLGEVFEGTAKEAWQDAADAMERAALLATQAEAAEAQADI